MNNKKNVCLIVPNVFPVPAVNGGACETLVETIIKMNEIFNKVNITCVSIYDEKAYKKSKEYQNTKFIYIKNNDNTDNIDLTFETEDKKLYSYMDAIYENIKDEDLDYIAIEGGDQKAYKYLLKKFPKQKCIMHIHGATIGDNEFEQIYQYYIAVSNYIADYFLSSGVIEKQRVKVLYNGIETEKFKRKLSIEEKQELKHKFNIKENEKVIMFCGRTVIGKGIKELILAFKMIKNIDNAKLLIVGNSAFGKKIQTEFDKELIRISQDIKDKIVFTSFVPNDVLYKIHNIADIAVVPTIAEEAFGMVVVEAMVSGLPLIVTRSGGIPEIVSKENAIILEKDEFLIENMAKSLDLLITDKNKRTNMGIKGKELAEKFSAQNFYKNFVKIIDELYKNNNFI